MDHIVFLGDWKEIWRELIDRHVNELYKLCRNINWRRFVAPKMLTSTQSPLPKYFSRRLY